MYKREKGSFEGKGTLLLKLAVLWLCVVFCTLLRHCQAQGESFAMLMVDWRTQFADNPAFWSDCRGRILQYSLIFGGLLLWTLVTENFCWNVRILRWRFAVMPAGRLFRGISMLFAAGAVFVSVFMGTAFLGPEIERAARGGGALMR